MQPPLMSSLGRACMAFASMRPDEPVARFKKLAAPSHSQAGLLRLGLTAVRWLLLIVVTVLGPEIKTGARAGGTGVPVPLCIISQP